MAALRYGRLQSADGTLGRPALVLFANTPNVSSVANFADAGRVAAVDSIDICHRRRRSAANAGSVVLTAERRGYIVGGLVFRHSTLCTVTFDTIGNVVVS